MIRTTEEAIRQARAQLKSTEGATKYRVTYGVLLEKRLAELDYEFFKAMLDIQIVKGKDGYREPSRTAPKQKYVIYGDGKLKETK